MLSPTLPHLSGELLFNFQNFPEAPLFSLPYRESTNTSYLFPLSSELLEGRAHVLLTLLSISSVLKTVPGGEQLHSFGKFLY